MNKILVKNGDIVKAKFRKYGVHSIIGEVFEVSTDEHALEGTWVSIRVNGGDLKDRQVQWMIANKINCMVPIKDVVEVIE